MQTKTFVLKKRPEGHEFESALELKDLPLPAAQPGEVVLRNHLLSLDPTNSIWMRQDGYMPAVALGAPMRGLVIGEVIDSRYPDIGVGQYVSVLAAWQSHSVVQGAQCGIVPYDGTLPLEAFFCTTGMVALTAYFGLTQAALGIKPTDTVVISGAAGAVGSIAVQIAKLLGAQRVVGIAGGADKCDWLVKELGADAAIDYKAHAGDLAAEVGKACPKGVDVYFDNTAGTITDAVVSKMNKFGRVALCGAISSGYDGNQQAQYSYGDILMRSINLKGFIVSDYAAQTGEAFGRLLEWTKSGKLKYRVDVREGLECAPAALRSLFDGSNSGKLVVRLVPAPQK